ncbi:MAG: hypothetical protein DMG65_07535 [Candidatus Angelobacter sp. Gp1-AA117]|nr:MAG: hypothetical protein DMG65_07535 [Candidatus Angelobacter sp. Gp1-AA117]
MFYVLSISDDPSTAPIRNTVLAHAGYGVIPVRNISIALEVMAARQVSIVVIGNSIPPHERMRVCTEALRRGIPSVVLDSRERGIDGPSTEHFNPLDGPEAFLEKLAALVRPRQSSR